MGRGHDEARVVGVAVNSRLALCVRAGNPWCEICGFAVGHRGSAAQSWHRLTQVALTRAGMSDVQIGAVMADYLLVSEIHVRPARQGRGVGTVLLREFLAGWEGSVQLTVRDTDDGGAHSRAWRLYQSFGFIPIARKLLMAGGGTPFAVLSRPGVSPLAQWVIPAQESDSGRDAFAGQQCH